MNRVTLKSGFIIICALGLGSILFSLSGEDEFSEVRRLYRELLVEAAVGADTPPLERLFKAKRVAAHFAEDVSGEIISQGVEKKRKVSRKRIERQLVGAYRVSREIRPEIVTENYSKDEDGVKLSSTLRVYGEKPGEDVMYLEELKVKLHLDKREGDWLITKAMVERVPRS